MKIVEKKNKNYLPRTVEKITDIYDDEEDFPSQNNGDYVPECAAEDDKKTSKCNSLSDDQSIESEKILDHKYDESESMYEENVYDADDHESKIMYENLLKKQEKEEKITKLKQRKKELQEKINKNKQTKEKFETCSTDLAEKKASLSAKKIEFENVIAIIDAFHQNANVEDLKSNDSCANYYSQWKETRTNDDLNINFKEFDITSVDKCFKDSVNSLRSQGETEAIAARDKIKKKYEDLSDKQQLTEIALIGVSMTQMMLIGVALFWGLDCKNKKPKKKKKKNEPQENRMKQNSKVKVKYLSPSPPVNCPSPSPENTNSDSGQTLSTTYDYGPVGSEQDFLYKRSMSNTVNPFRSTEWLEYGENKSLNSNHPEN